MLLKRPGTTEARSSWTFSDHPEYGEGLGKRDGVSLVPLKVVLVRSYRSTEEHTGRAYRSWQCATVTRSAGRSWPPHGRAGLEAQQWLHDRAPRALPLEVWIRLRTVEFSGGLKLCSAFNPTPNQPPLGSLGVWLRGGCEARRSIGAVRVFSGLVYGDLSEAS
jgi:hypothetical protein